MIIIMKKIYLFYLFDEPNKMKPKIYPAIDDLNIINNNNLSYVLYGWTPNKNVRNQFKKLRDMYKFKESVHEISKEDFDKFSDENSDTFLEERLVTTKQIENGFTKSYKIRILTTKKELDIMIFDELSILRNQLENVISKDVYVRSNYFINKYRNMLEFFKLDDILLTAYPLDESDCPPFNLFMSDNLAIYSHLYQNTYRKDIDNENL